MIAHVADIRPKQVAMITECSMAATWRSSFRSALHAALQSVPHMKRISLDKILRTLQTMKRDRRAPDVARRAKQALDRMLAVGRGANRD